MIAAVFLILLFVFVIVLGTAYWSFNRRINREIRGLLSGAKSGPVPVVTREMIVKLPPPVQRYMVFSRVLGKPIPGTVRLKQIGKIRQAADSRWMKLEAVQYYSTNPPGFVWKAFLPARAIPITLGRDAYLNGRGSMLIKLLSFVPVAAAIGPETDQGAMMRYLNEMTWFPAAFLGGGITWKAIDDTSAEVTLTHGTRSVSATMTFDQDGRPLDFVARRQRMVGRGFSLETWSTPFTGFGEFEELRLPVRGQAVWKLEEGDLVYIDVEITELEYDKTSHPTDR